MTDTDALANIPAPIDATVVGKWQESRPGCVQREFEIVPRTGISPIADDGYEDGEIIVATEGYQVGDGSTYRQVTLYQREPHGDSVEVMRFLAPGQARKFAAAVLRAADTVEFGDMAEQLDAMDELDEDTDVQGFNFEDDGDLDDTDDDGLLGHE